MVTRTRSSNLSLRRLAHLSTSMPRSGLPVLGLLAASRTQFPSRWSGQPVHRFSQNANVRLQVQHLARVVVVLWLGNWLLRRIFHPLTSTNPVVRVFLRHQNLVYPLLTNPLSPYHPWRSTTWIGRGSKMIHPCRHPFPKTRCFSGRLLWLSSHLPRLSVVPNPCVLETAQLHGQLLMACCQFTTASGLRAMSQLPWWVALHTLYNPPRSVLHTHIDPSLRALVWVGGCSPNMAIPSGRGRCRNLICSSSQRLRVF